MPALESPVRAAHRQGQPGSMLEGWCDPFPAITSITQVRGNLRRPSQWPSKRCDTEALALGRLGRTWQPKQQAHEGGPRCNESSPWSATATLLMCRGSILRQAASLARRRASRNVRPRSPGKRQGEPPLGADVPRTGTGLGGGTKKARRPFLNDLQTSLELYRSIFGAGNESCTRALSLCFPITFSTVVISEELNYSLVFALGNKVHPTTSTSVQG